MNIETRAGPGAALLALAALLAPLGASANGGSESVVYNFDLPSTSTSSQTPPYPNVGTLTLTQTATGVQFLLSPNWTSSSGYAAQSFVERLDFVYQGPADPTVTYVSGAQFASSTYETNPNNMDSGYKTEDQHILINWYTGKNDDRFEAVETSSWLVAGAQLSDFTGTQAFSDAKPSPVFGVISVTAYSLDGLTPTPSNWVSGVAPIPEPETYALMLAGLGAVAFVSRRRRASTAP